MKKHPVYRSKWGFADKELAQKYLMQYQKMNPNVGMHDKVTIEELAALFVRGYTVTLGEITSTRNEDLVRTDLLGIDIDNEDGNKQKVPEDLYLTPDEAIQMATEAGVPPAFVYSTFSDQPDHRKFRLVFVLERFITKKERAQVIDSLMSVFQKRNICLADARCRNHTRLFFGGKELLYEDYASTLSIKSVRDAEKKFNNYVTRDTLHVASENVEKSVVSVGVTPSEDGCYSTSPEVECIKHNKPEALRDLLKDKDILQEFGLDLRSPFPTEQLDAFDFLGKLPLNVVLGVSDRTRCLLPGHRDTTPSAFIDLYQGKYRYRCHGCGTYHVDGKDRVRSYDLVSLTMLFGNFSTKQAIDFLSAALNVEFESKWQAQAKKELEYSRRYLQSEQWEARFPVLARTMKKENKSFGIAIELLLYASDHINYESLALCGRPTFFLGKAKMSRLLKEKGMTGVSETSCQRKLNDLKRWGFLVEAADSDLRPEVVAKARELQKERTEQLAKQGMPGHEYRQAFYMIPSYTDAVWQEMENRIIAEYEGGFRRSHRSSLQARNYDYQIAEKAYAQVDVSKKSRKTLEIEQKIIDIASDLIQRQGFFAEADIKKELRGYSDKKKKKLLINTMPLVMKRLDLEKKRVNKDLKAQYNMDSSYTSGLCVYVKR